MNKERIQKFLREAGIGESKPYVDMLISCGITSVEQMLVLGMSELKEAGITHLGDRALLLVHCRKVNTEPISLLTLPGECSCGTCWGYNTCYTLKNRYPSHCCASKSVQHWKNYARGVNRGGNMEW